jgi:poly(glycerol-phosphate) alpha-glucosyltransferase
MGPEAFGYAPGLSRALKREGLDILHVHGLWMHYSLASLSWGRATAGATLLSPHGMLDPWALRNSGWKKQLALRCYEWNHLRGAACLHALCEAEAEAMRALGLRNAICIIPNSVEIPRAEVGSPPAWRLRIPAHSKVLLYLGRLHPKKGLVNLLQAWDGFSRARMGEWHLVIAGWDQSGHEHELRRLVAERKMRAVHFVGAQFGKDKAASFGSADAFVLPSLSEGLPMVVLEAWSHGLPALMTKECNLPEGFTAGAALEIGADRVAIRRGLDLLAQLSIEQRRDMGDKGRQLCRTRFSQRRSGEMMGAVYRWLLHGGPLPECAWPSLDGWRVPNRLSAPISLEVS